MQKKELALTLASAIAIFLLGSYSISYIRELSCRLLGMVGLWDLPWGPCLYYGEHFFWCLLFLFLIPFIYYIVKKYKINPHLENALLINSVLLPLAFFWRYVDIEVHRYHIDIWHVSNLWNPVSPPDPWPPVFLLVSASIIIVALLAVMLKILKKMENKYLVNSLALAIGCLFFIQVCIISSVNENYYSYRVVDSIATNCLEFAYKECGGKDDMEKLFRNPKATQEEIWAMERKLRNTHSECVYKLKEKLPILKVEVIRSMHMIPIAIVSLFFSLRIFRKKRFKNIILERGFGFSAIILWFYGIASVFSGLEIRLFNYEVLDLLFVLTITFGSLLLIAYLLGYKLKIKK